MKSKLSWFYFAIITCLTACTVYCLEEHLNTLATNLEQLASALKKPKTLAAPIPLKNSDKNWTTISINAAIQLLLAIKPLNRIILSKNYLYPKGSIAYAYIDLLHAIDRLPSILDHSYNDALNSLWDNELKNLQTMLIEWEKEENARRPSLPHIGIILPRIGINYATILDFLVYKTNNHHPLQEILDLIYITLQTHSMCENPIDNKIHESKSMNIRLSLFNYEYTKEFKSLDEAMKHFLAKRLIDMPGNKTCWDQTVIENIHDIVIISLYRPSENPITNTPTPPGEQFSVPMTLDFKNYLSDKNIENEYLYDLIGVNQHNGVSPGSGSQVIYTHQNGQWHECIDEQITAKTSDDIQHSINNSFVTGFFLILVYQKKPQQT